MPTILFISCLLGWLSNQEGGTYLCVDKGCHMRDGATTFRSIIKVSCCLISTDSPPTPHPHFASLRLFSSSFHLLTSFSTEHPEFSSPHVVIHGAQLEPKEGRVITVLLSGTCSSALVSSQRHRLLFPVSSLIPQLAHNRQEHRNKMKQCCVVLFARPDIFQNGSAGESGRALPPAYLLFDISLPP